MEEWRDIQGYEGLYKVSDCGRIARVYKTKPYARVLKPIPDKDGYLLVSLCKGNVAKRYRIHRLVACAFLENPSGLPVVNHKDENKNNNKAENLEWCSVQYNTVYKNAHIKRVENRKRAVCQFSMDGTFIKLWESATEASREIGIRRSNISCCCLRYPHFNTAGGFIWRYKE